VLVEFGVVYFNIVNKFKKSIFGRVVGTWFFLFVFSLCSKEVKIRSKSKGSVENKQKKNKNR